MYSMSEYALLDERYRTKTYYSTALLQRTTSALPTTYWSLRLHSSLMKAPHLRWIRCNVTLARDLYLESLPLLNGSRAPARSHNPSVSDFHSVYVDGSDSRRNADILKNIKRDANLKKQLSHRTNRIQAFIGPTFPLLFHDLLAIACGGANMKIPHNQTPTGSAFDSNAWVHQEVLRQWGHKYFRSVLLSATLFSDLTFLSQPKEELQQALSTLPATDSLVCTFMKYNLLYDCVIPYKGAHLNGRLTHNDANILRAAIRDETSVGSFFTMLGLLLFRFDRNLVESLFCMPKVFEGSSGVFALSTSTKT